MLIGGIRGTAGVDEDDGAGVFKRAQGQGRRDEEALRARIESQAGIAAVAQGPLKESRGFSFADGREDGETKIGVTNRRWG